MKKTIISFIAGVFVVSGCVDLNLNPLTDGSSENWFSNAQEVEMALNETHRRWRWL